MDEARPERRSGRWSKSAQRRLPAHPADDGDQRGEPDPALPGRRRAVRADGRGDHAFGLLFSTFLTLGVIPVTYSVLFGVGFGGFTYVRLAAEGDGPWEPPGGDAPRADEGV
jgi:hypothetical protein